MNWLSRLLVPLKLDSVLVADADLDADDAPATGTASSAEKWLAGRWRAPVENILAGPDPGARRAALGTRWVTPRVP